MQPQQAHAVRASERLGNRTAENRHVGDGSLGWKYETWRKSQELKLAICGRLRDEEEANLQALRRRIIHSLDSRQIRQPDRSGPDHGRGCCYQYCFEASRSCVAAVMHPFRRAPTRECRDLSRWETNCQEPQLRLGTAWRRGEKESKSGGDYVR